MSGSCMRGRTSRGSSQLELAEPDEDDTADDTPTSISATVRFNAIPAGDVTPSSTADMNPCNTFTCSLKTAFSRSSRISLLMFSFIGIDFVRDGFGFASLVMVIDGPAGRPNVRPLGHPIDRPAVNGAWRRLGRVGGDGRNFEFVVMWVSFV